MRLLYNHTHAFKINSHHRLTPMPNLFAIYGSWKIPLIISAEDAGHMAKAQEIRIISSGNESRIITPYPEKIIDYLAQKPMKPKNIPYS